VAICSLHRHVAEVDLKSAEHWLPACRPATGKRVAIIGASPAGLGCAWELLKLGHACTILDSHPLPGGTLRYGLEPGKLPAAVLDAEVELIARLGARWQMGATIAAVPPSTTMKIFGFDIAFSSCLFYCTYALMNERNLTNRVNCVHNIKAQLRC
jgi:NADPH-dependent glutamate synthase beta subunit-like oxidoreductase